VTTIAKLEDVIAIRDYEPADRAYVLRTWLETGAPEHEARSVRREYYPGESRLLEEHLRVATVRVACLSDSPAVIVGFVVFDRERELVHHATVNRLWRGQGVLQALLEAAWQNR
jgi:GNAT superfamily N-acetyltransferase